jgi:hypothetical protein
MYSGTNVSISEDTHVYREPISGRLQGQQSIMAGFEIQFFVSGC